MKRRDAVLAPVIAVLLPMLGGWLISALLLSPLPDLISYVAALGVIILWTMAGSRSPGRLSDRYSHALFLGVPLLLFLLNLIPYTATPSVINVFWQHYFLPFMWIINPVISLVPPAMPMYMWMYHLVNMLIMDACYLLAYTRRLRRKYA